MQEFVKHYIQTYTKVCNNQMLLPCRAAYMCTLAGLYVHPGGAVSTPWRGRMFTLVGLYVHPGRAVCSIRVPAFLWPGWEYWQCTRIHLALVRVPAYPWHRSGSCILLTLVRIPAYLWHRSGYLHTSDTGQDTCRIPAGILQVSCVLLTLVSIPARYLLVLLNDFREWSWSWLLVR